MFDINTSHIIITNIVALSITEFQYLHSLHTNHCFAHHSIQTCSLKERRAENKSVLSLFCGTQGQLGILCVFWGIMDSILCTLLLGYCMLRRHYVYLFH